MYNVVKKISNTVGYIKVEGHNLIVVPDVQSASKFNYLGADVNCILNRAEVSFKNEVFEIAPYFESDFSVRPRNVVKKGSIVNDSYFYTNYD